jgi:threonine aldolase
MTLAAPIHGFASDNVVGAHPAVMDALVAANTGSAQPYGDDRWTERAVAGLRALFEAPDAEVLLTYGGTGANVAALQALLLPHEAIVCPVSAHINTSEGGAPERFTGAKLIDVPVTEGKLAPADVAHLMGPFRGEQRVRPAVIAISQATEWGTVYSLGEIAALAEFAHAHGLALFVDGARLANGVAALGCSMREMTLDLGVDALTFGGTKNGLLYGEAVIFLRPQLAQRARFARKQATQLASKMRFIGAQFLALLEDDLWLRNAQHANRMASKLAAAAARVDGVRVVRAPAANSVFAQLREPDVARLQAWSPFLLWDAQHTIARWMTSFATTGEDIERFVAGLSRYGVSACCRCPPDPG